MNIFLKILSRIMQSFNGLLAIILTLLVVLIVCLNGFVFWLNTNKGGEWITTQVNTGLNDSGYSVHLNGFSLSGIFGLKATSLELKWAENIIISGENITLSINPLPLGLKQIHIKMNAKILSVLSLPMNAEKKPETLQTLPNLYFNTARIKINIETLTLSENIIEGGFQTSLSFEQNLKLLPKMLRADGRMMLSNTHHKQSAFTPKTLKNKIQLDLEKQTLVFENIELQQENYIAKLNGSYGLENETVEAQLSGQWSASGDLSALLKSPIKLDATLKGTVQNFSGQATASTLYQNIKTSLEAQIERKDALILLNNINGHGGPLKLNGNIAYNIKSALADGQLDGNLTDLAFFNHFVDGLDLSGEAKATAKVFSKNGVQATSITSDFKGIKYKNYIAQSLKAQLDIDHVGDIQNLKADISVNKARLDNINIEKASLKALSNNGTYDLTLSGNGYSYNPFLVKAQASVASINPLSIALSNAELKTAQGKISASGTVEPDLLDIKIDGRDLILSQIAFADLSSLPIIVDRLSGNLTGTSAQPKIDASYSLRPVSENQYNATLEGNSTYTSGQLINTLTGKGPGIKSLTANLSVPFTISLEPFVFNMEDNVALKGEADMQADAQALSSLFLVDGYTVTGALTANTQISGTPSAPLLNGSAQLANSTFVDTYNDIQLTDINGQVTFNDRKIDLINLNAKDAEQKGNIAINGALDLTTLSSPTITASMQMNNMHLLKNKNYDAWLNADITVATKADGYVISGILSPEQASIRIPNQFDETIPELNIIEANRQKKPTDGFFEKTKLDVKFKADNKIFVSGRGLDAELQGNLNVTGNLKTPLVKGNLQTLRGRYEDFGRRFTLDKAILRFQGRVPPSPYLDIETSTDIEGITTKVLITNSIEDPQIKFASIPSLPEDEILSMILFGRDIQKISPFQAIQLANTLRKLSGKGGYDFDPLQQIQSLTGLDDIRVEGIGTEDATIGAGKYISDKVYLEVEQGTAASSGSASVEIEVMPNISLESKAAQNGETDIGVFWEWDY